MIDLMRWEVMSERGERLRLVRVSVYYYLAILISIVLLKQFAPAGASLDPSIAVILLIYLLVFPIVFIYTYRYALHIFLFMLAFISGIFAFCFDWFDLLSFLNVFYLIFNLYYLILPNFSK